MSRCGTPRGVQDEVVSWVGVELFAIREGVVIVLVGEGFGVDCLRGDGEAGDSGLRKGDARGEPKERGEGLYEADID